MTQIKLLGQIAAKCKINKYLREVLSPLPCTWWR